MKYFYECGGCDNYHPLGFTGDCRSDRDRYNYDDEGNMVNALGEGVRLYLFEIVDEDSVLPSPATAREAENGQKIL